MAELEGRLATGTTIDIALSSPAWIELHAVIVQAIEPYPDAKEALIGALQDYEGRDETFS
jgi:hypothetical protein